MSHYAKVFDGKVLQVIVPEKDFIDTYIDAIPGEWIQTSYNTRGNVHYGADGQPDGGLALRGNYAGIGHFYDREHDVFYPPKPFDSWILNNETWLWQAPVPYPTDGNLYEWNESSVNWQLL